MECLSDAFLFDLGDALFCFVVLLVVFSVEFFSDVVSVDADTVVEVFGYPLFGPGAFS